LQRRASELGRSVKVRAQVGNFDSMCRLIESNVGIGLLPLSTAERYAKTMVLEIVEIADAWTSIEAKICVRKSSAISKQVRSLIEFLVEDPKASRAIATLEKKGTDARRGRQKKTGRRTKRRGSNVEPRR
jgi:DNA-binding transcriptional LysR family regulator